MPDQIERKRLKKKMLDRWENEGGRVAADPLIADQAANEREGEGGQASVSNNSSRVKSTSSSKKRRARDQK